MGSNRPGLRKHTVPKIAQIPGCNDVHSHAQQVAQIQPEPDEVLLSGLKYGRALLAKECPSVTMAPLSSSGPLFQHRTGQGRTLITNTVASSLRGRMPSTACAFSIILIAISSAVEICRSSATLRISDRVSTSPIPQAAP